MATLYRELVSDELLCVDPTRRRVQDSIAASHFAPLSELRLAAEGDAEVDEAPLNERAAFKLNYLRWLDESVFDSLPAMMRSHESYQSIVERGQRVLPFLAAELRRQPSFIFLALEDITGADPVPEEALGNLQATTDAWLSWLQS